MSFGIVSFGWRFLSCLSLTAVLADRSLAIPPIEGEISSAPSFQNTDAIAGVAVGTTGACCDPTPSCSRVANQTVASCTALGGVYQGDKTICANDLCGCLVRACCGPGGTCLGDTSRTCCESGLQADGMTPWLLPGLNRIPWTDMMERSPLC